MKKIILMISLLFICGCKVEKNIYKIDLSNDPYNICGEKIYFSNDSWDDEIDIDDIIERIYYACDIDNKNEILDNYNEAKNEIDYLISNSDDYTKEEFINELEYIYDYLLN